MVNERQVKVPQCPVCDGKHFSHEDHPFPVTTTVTPIHPAHFASNNAVKTKLLTIHDLMCDGFTRPALEQVAYLLDNLEVSDP